jgi:16S rRNA (cytosine1402-N4)-methyltransferase
LLGIDRDPQALERARRHLSGFAGRFELVQGNFADMAVFAGKLGWSEVDRILLDLGVSSEQLDTPSRGFSFRGDGPLDMRMDPSGSPTAADLVNCLSEAELREIIAGFGEEGNARRIAAAIVRERAGGRIESTAHLAGIVERTVGRGGRIHPATRTFQALRIAVNGEIESLNRALESGLGILAAGGRMAVISFHSIEDRAVKTFFAAHAGRWESLQQGGRSWAGAEPRVRPVTRRCVKARAAETEDNPRARSAKLRVAERTAGRGS